MWRINGGLLRIEEVISCLLVLFVMVVERYILCGLWSECVWVSFWWVFVVNLSLKVGLYGMGNED